MDQIKDVINDVVEGLSSGKNRPQEQILKIWQEVLGKKTSKHTKIMGLYKGVLLVNVDSSVWLFHLNLKRGALLKKLRSATGELKEIKIRIGSVK